MNVCVDVPPTFSKAMHRVAAALNENASVSSRVEAAQRRFSDLEKTLTALRKDSASLRLIAQSLGALLVLLCLALALALLVNPRR